MPTRKSKPGTAITTFADRRVADWSTTWAALDALNERLFDLRMTAEILDSIEALDPTR
jgi:hypothetical protein